MSYTDLSQNSTYMGRNGRKFQIDFVHTDLGISTAESGSIKTKQRPGESVEQFIMRFNRVKVKCLTTLLEVRVSKVGLGWSWLWDKEDFQSYPSKKFGFVPSNPTQRPESWASKQTTNKKPSLCLWVFYEDKSIWNWCEKICRAKANYLWLVRSVFNFFDRYLWGLSQKERAKNQISNHKSSIVLSLS